MSEVEEQLELKTEISTSKAKKRSEDKEKIMAIVEFIVVILHVV